MGSTHDHAEHLFQQRPFFFLWRRVKNSWIQRNTIWDVENGFYKNMNKQKVYFPTTKKENESEWVPVFYDAPPIVSELPSFSGELNTQFSVVGNDMVYECSRLKSLGTFKSPIVLDLASQLHPGGSYRSGATAQEEDLCRRSDLWKFLEPLPYPHPEAGGYYLPRVSFFREGVDKEYQYKDAIDVLPVLCVAAIRNPDLEHTPDGPRLSANDIDATIRCMWTQFKMAYDYGHDALVLGAFGCGAFHNPPEQIAQLYLQTVTRFFPGVFAQITFSILPPNGGNFLSFQKVVEQHVNQSSHSSESNTNNNNTSS